MKNLWKSLVGLVVVVFLTTAFAAAPKATEVAPESVGLIEVCNQGTAYVPQGTRYVTCQGRVMRVVGEARVSGDKGGVAPDNMGVDCYCPKCCGGTCGVIVSCGGGDLCTLYLSCGD